MASTEPEMILKARWVFTAYLCIPPSNLISSTSPASLIPNSHWSASPSSTGAQPGDKPQYLGHLPNTPLITSKWGPLQLPTPAAESLANKGGHRISPRHTALRPPLTLSSLDETSTPFQTLFMPCAHTFFSLPGKCLPTFKKSQCEGHFSYIEPFPHLGSHASSFIPR